MRILKFILPLLVLALGVGIFQHLRSNRVEPEPIRSEVRPPVVAVKEAALQSISPQLTLFGRIEAPSNSEISASISADVLVVRVREGDAVEAGEVMVQLDDADVTLQMLQRKASIAEIEAQMESDRLAFAADKELLAREQELLALARKAVERSRTLARSRAGTEATLDNALQQEQQQLLAVTQRQLRISDHASRQKLWQARLDSAMAALDQAERDFERTVVRAPYSGRINQVMVSPGDRASPGTPLVRLYDSHNLEVRAQVPGRYIPILQGAVDADTAVDASVRRNDRVIELQLDRLSASVAAGQGGVDVFFRAENGLLPVLGTTVEVSLELPTLSGVVAVSPDALYGDNRIYLVEEGRLRSVEVSRLGFRLDEAGHQQLVLDGAPFAGGGRILVSRLPQAIDGLSVEPVVTDD